ncbi:hypothetical protein BCR42DRAFT_410140 [Absidia repens]|uniref:Uncharacterized protein n=1 Tax=Absidia repens TaxID=90262 RepID=A0A1X2INM8_9FUNG|nr:hypothetical protein BCR42DRAFT_410140 [Absidia repens]
MGGIGVEINDMRYDEREKRWHGNEQATRPFDAPAKRRPALIKNMMTARTAKSTSAMVVGNMTFDHQKMSWNTCNGEEEIDVLAHIDDLSENETHAPFSASSRSRRRLETHKTAGSHRPSPSTWSGTATARTPSPSFVESSDRQTSSSSRSYRNANNTTNRLPPLTTTTATEQPTDDHHRITTTTTPPSFSEPHHRSSGGSGGGILREFDLPIDIQRQMVEQEERHKTYFGAWPLRDECEMTETPSGYVVPQNTYILY